MSNQKDKVWFVTGASKGFGLALTKLLLAKGNKVAATSRNKKNIEDSVGNNPNLLTLTVDITNNNAVKKAIDETVTTFGRIDVVVNNAGYMLLGSLEEVSAEEYHQSASVNIYAFLNVIRNAMPHFRKQKSGHVFNFSSSAGYGGDGYAGSYNSAKSAVIGFSETLAQEVKPFNVKVTIVSPGYFRTSFLEKGAFAIAGNKVEGYITNELVALMNQMNGNQYGDPEKLVAALVNIAEEENPPLHLLMGKDAYERASNYYQTRLSELEKWKAVSTSTDL